MSKQEKYKDARTWGNPEPANTIGLRLLHLDGGGEHVRVKMTSKKALQGAGVITSRGRSYRFERNSPDGPVFQEVSTVDLAELEV